MCCSDTPAAGGPDTARRTTRAGLVAVTVAASMCLAGGGRIPAADPPAEIDVPNVFLRLGEDIELPAREAGVLGELTVKEGDLVEAGDVIARIEDSEARLLRERATLDVQVARREADRSIEIEYAQKARGVAEAELKRAERSREAVPGAVSLTEVDRLRLETEKADAEIRRIQREQQTAELTTQLKEAELALATLQLERHEIVAPVAGQVVEHFRNRGEWVEPGMKVVRVIRLDVLRAEGYLPASQARADLIGASVSLRLDSTGRDAEPFEGRIVFISPEVEPTTGQVLVRAEIDNPDLVLRPGLRAAMTIHPTAADEPSPDDHDPSSDDPKPATGSPSR